MIRIVDLVGNMLPCFPLIHGKLIDKGIKPREKTIHHSFCIDVARSFAIQALERQELCLDLAFIPSWFLDR